MVRIDISNRVLFVYGGLFILFLSVGFVIAYNSGGPPNVMGHSAEELDISLECVTLTYLEDNTKTIFQSSTSYFFEDVGIASNPNQGTAVTSEIECRTDNGWIMTGCSSLTYGTEADNDEQMFNNSCRSDEAGLLNEASVRCCKIA